MALPSSVMEADLAQQAKHGRQPTRSIPSSFTTHVSETVLAPPRDAASCIAPAKDASRKEQAAEEGEATSVRLSAEQVGRASRP